MTAISLIILMAGMAPQDNKEVQHAVQNWLTEHTGMARPSDLMREIKTPTLYESAKTGASFVHYREFPVAMGPNPPLVQRNVFLVRNGKAEHFKTRETMRKSFIACLPELGMSVLLAVSLEYALASAHFSQDGMFQFVTDKKNVNVSDQGSSKVVNAKIPVVEKGGDTGNLSVKLVFKPSNGKFKLQSIEEKDTIQPGVRPICQSTLLLDSNPLVRRMAERDLLIMGESALDYLDEQAAKAGPELRREMLRVKARILKGER